jgi:F0F1-type ATP synthase delta subunit
VKRKLPEQRFWLLRKYFVRENNMSLSSTYATVIREMGEASLPKIIAYMKSRSHLSLLPHIANLVERERAHDESVVVATEEDAAQARAEFPHAEVVVDPNVVGGRMVRRHSRLTDTTHRRALVSIYKRAITNE